MTASARSIYAFGLYLAGLSVLLLAAPDLLLGPFGFPPVHDVWVRVTGMLVLILAWYYLVAARAGLVPFIRASVPARASVVLFFAGFIAIGWAPPALLLFGGVDLAAAAWTGWLLRHPARVTGTGPSARLVP
jgi:hypothetical protein